MQALEASIELLREKAGSEEHLYHMVEQYGLEPLYKRLKLSKKSMYKKGSEPLWFK